MAAALPDVSGIWTVSTALPILIVRGEDTPLLIPFPAQAVEVSDRPDFGQLWPRFRNP